MYWLSHFLFVGLLGGLGMFHWRLAMGVIRLRRQHKLAVGSVPQMERALAAQRNFTEHTPINLIAPALVFANGHALLACVPLALLLAGRLFHAHSLLNPDEADTAFKYRIWGMKLTFYSTLAGIVCLAVSVVLNGF